MDYRNQLKQSFILDERGTVRVVQWLIDGSIHEFVPKPWKPDGISATQFEAMLTYDGPEDHIVDNYGGHIGKWYPVDSDIVWQFSWPENWPPQEPGAATILSKFVLHIRNKDNHLDTISGEVSFINRLKIEKTEDPNKGSWARSFNNGTFNEDSTAKLEFSPDGYWYWSGNGTSSASGMWSHDGLPGSAAQIRITEEVWRDKCFTNVTTTLQDLSVERYFRFMVPKPDVAIDGHFGGMQLTLEILEKGTGRLLSTGEVIVGVTATS